MANALPFCSKPGIVRDEEDKRRRTAELDRRTEENRKNARLAAAYITDTHKMAEEARRKADAAKPEKDYILEAIIAAALVVFLVPQYGACRRTSRRGCPSLPLPYCSRWSYGEGSLPFSEKKGRGDTRPDPRGARQTIRAA